MLWRKGCFRGERMTCQDSSWHWNALPSPSANTRMLITPLFLAAATNHPLWPPQLPQCCSAAWDPKCMCGIHTVCPTLHLMSPQDTSLYTHTIPPPPSPLHGQTSYKNLGLPLDIPPSPLCGETAGTRIGLCLIQVVPVQTSSSHTLQGPLTGPQTPPPPPLFLQN